MVYGNNVCVCLCTQWLKINFKMATCELSRTSKLIFIPFKWKLIDIGNGILYTPEQINDVVQYEKWIKIEMVHGGNERRISFSKQDDWMYLSAFNEIYL